MDIETTTHTLIASDRVEGTAVRRANGDKIGTIQRLMVDKLSGKVAYAVFTFGGFFGLGQKHLPIPWALLHYDPKLEAYQIDMTDAELAHAHTNDEFDWGDRSESIDMRGRRPLPTYWGAY